MSDIPPHASSLFPQPEPGVSTRGDPVWNAVPVPLTPLLGRDKEIQQICRLLSTGQTRLLTLTGPGGVGKTRLAIEVAAQMAPNFAHGACFVALDSIRDPQLVDVTLAQAIGIEVTGQNTSRDILLSMLEERHLLLVLDTAEHVVSGVASWLADVIARWPLLRVMVTSRIAVRIDGEQRFPVPPLLLPTCRTSDDLTVNAAVMLFAQRARAVNPDFVLTDVQAGVIAQICRHLDGIPLAIELAASRVSVHSPSAILARLTDRLSLLTCNRRDAPDRHQTMRDAIAWSYNLLLPHEQAVFRRLAVFVGGFTVDAVEAVGGSIDIDVLTLLFDHSLVRCLPPTSEGSRIGMYETIREFALEKLVAHGEEVSTRDTHAAYYLRMASEAGEGTIRHALLSWFAYLEHDQDNLRAAIVWLAHRGQIEEALKLATDALWYQRIRGLYVESRDLLDSGLPAGQENVRTRSRADVYDGIHQSAPLLGDLYRAKLGTPEAHSIGADLLALTHFALDNAVLATELGAGSGDTLDDAIRERFRYLPSPVSADAPAEPGVADSPMALTSRELDILRLIADGLTNQEIADMLSISLRTVTSHVTHVLTKLALTSRTAAVSYAIRHGLI